MCANKTSLQFIYEVVRMQASRNPDVVAIYLDGDKVVTYADLWRLVQDCADWMKRSGVGAGDRVLVAGENGIEMIVFMFACSILNAWVVPVNARLSSREIDTIIVHSDPRVVYFTAAVSQPAAEHAARQAASPSDVPGLATTNMQLIRTVQTGPDTSDNATRVAALIYTSGTTGAPKGVMVPHRGLVHFAGVSAGSRRLGVGDIAYAALPLSHIFGFATVLVASFYAGASLVVRQRFDVADLRKALVKPGLTMLQGVPTMFSLILADIDANGPMQAPALRYVYTGGAALDLALKQKVERTFGMPLHHGYGITEYAGSLFVTDIDNPRDDCTAGYAVEGLEIHVGPLDQPAHKPGQSGDIHVRGPGVMLGYYRNPEQTAEALPPGGWLNTGDIGYLDEKGALFITGRSKDLIIRSGFNVYPLEVEEVINLFDGISDSAVVGLPDSDGNERIVAFFVQAAGKTVDTAALDAYLRKQLAPYKRPAVLIPIDTLPTTLSGKIKKQTLRDLALSQNL